MDESDRALLYGTVVGERINKRPLNPTARAGTPTGRLVTDAARCNSMSSKLA